MTDIIKIPTADYRFPTAASSKTVSLGNSNNDRQPEMADETRSTYISKTTTYSIEIPTANLGLTSMQQEATTGNSDMVAKTGNNLYLWNYDNSVEIRDLRTC